MSPNLHAQKFNLYGNKNSQTISFKLINNLIIIPVEINGTKLQFILDSGVGAPVIFNLSDADSLSLPNVEPIKVRGLGTGEPIDALHSKNNIIRIEAMISGAKDIYIIHKDQFDLSSKLGEPVHGMIGYDLLRDFVVTVDYTKEKITFMRPESYKYKKCKKCETFDLEFFRKKPYINAQIVTSDTSVKKDVKLLIDSGGSDAVWLFEDEELKVPEKSFHDFIGEGITGSIYGRRAKLERFELKNFVLNQPNVAYLDSASSFYARRFKERNGSLGGDILKRFKVTFDYPNKKITLKKNNKFKDRFGYNMSGLEVVYGGKELVKIRDNATFIVGDNSDVGAANRVIVNVAYDYQFKPIYTVHKVRPNSPAALAGIKEGDMLVKINNNWAYNYDLQQIIEHLYHKKNKVIRLKVNRDGQEIDFKFKLIDMLQ
ncbi:aspartyl protease family protein [Urechidicola sp. KH5]